MSSPTQNKRARFWAQAAAFGALWGGVEITLGAFIHTVRIPFSGALLAAFGTAILVAQRQVVPMRGLSLATGAVAALCKSMSPGGVILGPMLGILSEALAVELALLLAPRSSVSALLAGVLAASATVLHQLFSLWLYYGGGVLELIIEALRKVGQLAGSGSHAGWWAACALGMVIVALGGAGGLIGRHLGRDARTILEPHRASSVSSAKVSGALGVEVADEA